MFPQTNGLGEFCFKGVALLRRIKRICVFVCYIMAEVSAQNHKNIYFLNTPVIFEKCNKFGQFYNYKLHTKKH